MIHHSAFVLPLLLTSLAGSSAMLDYSYGPSQVEITGADVVTVGIPYGFNCLANCYPSCLFSWTRGNETSEGPLLTLQLHHLLPELILTCTVVNPTSGESVSVHKTLQVTAGPTNVKISGPPMLTIGAPSTFTCSASCSPSCSYSWTVFLQGQPFSTTQGDTISVTPPASTVISESLICTAKNTVSHLFASTTLSLWVASLYDISITGAGTVTMGKEYTFICQAVCIPSCTFTWKYMGKTFHGDIIYLPVLRQGDQPKLASRVDITLSNYMKMEPLTCEATNELSLTTISTTTNLTVIDPISVRPNSQAHPVVGEPFSLQCVGSQNPASITWLKNGRPTQASERVHFSPDNTTMIFDRLLKTDNGLYQCVVAQGGTPIQSVSYNMQINYGPDKVLIVEPNKGPVGGEMVVPPGSTTELQCSADCFPACSITWFYHDVLVSTQASIVFTPVTPPYKAALTCVAFNPVTRTNRTAKTMVVVPDGPKNVAIKGPDSLEVGVTSSFTCTAECSPSCSFTWTLYGKTVTGRELDITLNRHISSESISCRAENTVTGKTATTNETLSVSDPHWCGC